MAVIINEFEVLTEPPAPATPPAAPDGGGEPEPDLRALQALLAREAWRDERLHAD
jgi:hypothetical protein